MSPIDEEPSATSYHIDVCDVGVIPPDAAGYITCWDQAGQLVKRYITCNSRAIIRTLRDDDIRKLREMFDAEGLNVESLTVFHSPRNSFTYRNGFAK